MPIDPVNDRRPPITPQLALRVAVAGRRSRSRCSAIIFFRLWYLQVLDGDQYLAQARETACATERDPGAARRDRRPQPACRSSTTARPRSSRSTRASCPTPMRERSPHAGASGRRPRAKRAEGQAGPAVADRRGARPARCARATSASRASSTCRRKTINAARGHAASSRCPTPTCAIKTDVPASQRNYILERQTEFPGVAVEQRLPAPATPSRTLGRPAPRHDRRDQPSSSSTTERFSGVAGGTDDRQERAWSRSYDQLPARHATAATGSTSTRPASAAARDGPRQPKSRARSSSSRSTSSSSRRASRRSGDAGGGQPGGVRRASTRENGDVLAMGSYPSFDPRDALAADLARRAYDELSSARSAGSPLFNRADRRPYPTGSIVQADHRAGRPRRRAASRRATIYQRRRAASRSARAEADVRCNAGKVANGPVNLVDALRGLLRHLLLRRWA